MTNPTPGNPIITLWGTPPSNHQITNHPYVRWLCRTYEGSDSTHVLPHIYDDQIIYPAFSTDNEEAVIRIARRLREHAQTQTAKGHDMSSLSFFVQNLGYGKSTKSVGTPLLCKAPDDANAAGLNTEQTIYSDKAANGTLSVETDLIPILTFTESIRDQLKIELESVGLTAFGYFFDDCEDFHSPWTWCSSGGGNWDVMVDDEARAGTEDIVFSTYNISGDGATDMTLDEWITDEISNRNAAFAPSENVSWDGGTNLSTNSHTSLLRLRIEASQCQYGVAIATPMLDIPFFTSTKSCNYQVVGADNTAFPTLLSASGDAGSDHNTRFMPCDNHAPVFYPYNNSNGTINTDFTRFTPGLAWDSQKNYNMQACLGSCTRQMMAITQGSMPTAKVTPWIRGIDQNTTGRTPSHTVRDLASMIRFCRSWDTVDNVMIWYSDNTTDTPDYDAMYEAILQEYPV